jgi:hypothetical protein
VRQALDHDATRSLAAARQRALAAQELEAARGGGEDLDLELGGEAFRETPDHRLAAAHRGWVLVDDVKGAQHRDVA